jgi:hypothetical protein
VSPPNGHYIHRVKRVALSFISTELKLVIPHEFRQPYLGIETQSLIGVSRVHLFVPENQLKQLKSENVPFH